MIIMLQERKVCKDSQGGFEEGQKENEEKIKIRQVPVLVGNPVQCLKYRKGGGKKVKSKVRWQGMM